MANSAIGAIGALASLPAGSLVDFAGTFAPSGWIMCDGSAISRATYSTLFLAIGIAYGSGDGSATFNLPDFRGRFARFNDNMGTAQGAASRDIGRAHGSSQTQATAKNGLANQSSTVSGNVGGLWYGTRSFGYSATTSMSRWNDIPFETVGTQATISGTATAQDITGDTETRPVNLSCNRIIKY
jgi:hypothetical protein